MYKYDRCTFIDRFHPCCTQLYTDLHTFSFDMSYCFCFYSPKSLILILTVIKICHLIKCFFSCWNEKFPKKNQNFQNAISFMEAFIWCVPHSEHITWIRLLFTVCYKYIFTRSNNFTQKSVSLCLHWVPLWFTRKCNYTGFFPLSTRIRKRFIEMTLRMYV